MRQGARGLKRRGSEVAEGERRATDLLPSREGQGVGFSKGLKAKRRNIAY